MATNVFELYAKLGIDSSGFNKGLDTAKGKLSSVGSAITGGLGKIAKVGVAALGVASTAVVGFAKSAIDTGREFDSAMAQVGATLGKTTDEMGQNVVHTTVTINGQIKEFDGTLRDFARTMGSATKFTATECAQALNYMALAGYDAETSMQMLPNVLNLAAAGNMQLAEASDMVTDTQTAFGISLERTTLMVDEMAKAASTGNTNVQQLGEAFLRVGGLARELNGGFVTLSTGENVAVDGLQELEIAFTAMANAGVKGSEAGTHMRNMLLKLSSPTKEGSEALEAMGVAIFNAEGNMRSLSEIFGDLSVTLGQMTQGDKLQVISDLFNTRDMASAEALLAAVDQDWDRIGESILDAKVPLDTAVLAIQESTDAFKGMKTEGTGGLKDIAATARAAMGTFGGSVDDAAQMIAENFNVSLEDARIACSAVKGAMNEVSGAAAEMANTQLNNLNGDITRFQSALSDAKIELADKVIPTLRQFVQIGTQGIPKIVEGFQKGGLEGAMSAFGGVLDKVLEQVIKTIPDVVKAGGALLGALGQGIMDNMDKIINAGVEIITYLVDSMANGGLESFVDGAVKIISALGSALLQQAPALTKMAFDLATQLVTYLAEGVSADSGGLYAFITMLGNNILANLDPLLQAALQIITALVDGLLNALPAAMPVISQVILKLGEFLVQAAPLLFNSAATLLGELVNGLIAMLPSIVPMIVTFIQGLAQFIVDNAQSFMDSAVSLTLALIDGIMQALPDIITAIVDVVVALALALTEPTNLTLLINGAIMLMQAIIEGLLRAIPQLLAAVPEIVVNLVAALMAAIPELLAAVVLVLNDILTAIIEWIPELLLEIPALILAIADGIVAGADTLIECGKELIEGLWKGISERWKGLVEDIGTVGKGLIDSFKSLFGIHSPSTVFEGFGDNIVAGLSNGISQNDADAIKQMTDLANNMGEAFESIDTKIKSTIDTVVNNVTAFAKALYDLLDENSKQILQNIAQALTQLISKMIAGATNAVNGFINIWKTLVGKVQSVLTDIIGKVTGFISDLAAKAAEAAKGFVDAITEGVKNLPEQFVTIGKNMVDGIWKGLQEGWTWLTEKVGKLAQDLLDKAKNALGIHSPSTEFEYVGRMVDEGFAKGINDYIGMIDDAARNIESAVEIKPTIGTTAAGGVVNNTINIYPSRNMDEKALAREVSERLADLNNRSKATWRPVYA